MSRKPLALFFVFMTSIYLMTASGHLFSRDEVAMFFMARSLVQEGHFGVPQNINTGGGKLALDGTYYSPYGLGQPLVSVPFFLLGQWLTERTSFRYLAAFFVSFTNSIVTALTLSLILGYFLSLGYGRLASVLTTVVAGLTTIIWPYSRFFFSEPVVMLCQIAAFLSLQQWSLRHCGPGNRYVLQAGFFWGFAILTRPITLLFTPFLFLFLFLECKQKQKPLSLFPFMWMATLISIFCGLVAYYNWYRFGDPFDLGYGVLPSGSAQKFDFPVLKGLAVLLFSPGKSIFLFSPVLLISLWGWPSFFRRFKTHSIFILGLTGSYILLYANWCQIEGGYAWGPRFLVPIVLLFFVPFIESIQQIRGRSVVLKAIIFTVVGTSLFIQILGILVNYTDVIEATASDYYDPATGIYNFYYNPLPEHFGMLIDYAVGRKEISERFNRSVEQRKSLYIINLDWSDTIDLWFLHLLSDGVPRWIIFTVLLVCALSGLCAGRKLISWTRSEKEVQR